jgi:lipopolysaccharide/colanic/teichoic acid biosynthesis glycosyltransferase
MTLEEPIEAFPYKAPSKDLLEKYQFLLNLKEPIKTPVLKRVFDVLLSGLIIVGCLPIILLLYILNFIEGVFIPENKGPLFFYYNGISQGKVFRKYKLRIIKMSYIDPALHTIGDWHAYKKEWMPEARTQVGAFVKKFYLDEIPQFFSVFVGSMSIVGPRPLAVHHYERDLAQGNVTRKLLKGGLLGFGHIRKGTIQMGDPQYEFEYLDYCVRKSSLQLLKVDLGIIYKGILLMLKGKGL